MEGEIDNIDIVLGVNIILGIIEPFNELIDYNQDNENNIFDILKIVDYVLYN